MGIKSILWIFEILRRVYGVMGPILSRLERIDSLQVRGEYKARINKNYLLPACRFILTVDEPTNTNIDKLEVKCTQFLKLWVGLPHCTTPGVLHIPPFTDIPTICTLYLQSYATAHAFSRIKADDKVNTV